MSPLLIKIVLSCAVLLGLVVVADSTHLRLPGDDQGYEPAQPLAYSHRLHAGELRIPCLYCHYGAARSRHAGVPSASICMNCHGSVTAGLDAVLQERELAEAEQREPARVVSAELRRLYDVFALDEELLPIPGVEPGRIEWVRVHDLPDFVYFDHRVHVARGVACESCHGPVQSMERVRQVSSLSMGWCIDCHRANPARSGGPVEEHVSTDCAACHF